MPENRAIIRSKALREWPELATYKQAKAVLTAEECAGLIAPGEARSITADDPDAVWLAERLGKVAAEWNTKGYDFELFGMEPIELRRHPIGRGSAWVTGFGPGELSERKLGLMVALNAPDAYKGGRLEFFENEALFNSFELAVGDGTIYMPWLQHRLSAVAEGELWALWAWFVGPPLR